MTRMITRSIVPATVLAERRDGYFEAVEHPSRRAIQYAIGGTPPLPLSDALTANLDEYKRAVCALTAHQALIGEILPLLEDQEPQGPGKT